MEKFFTKVRTLPAIVVLLSILDLFLVGIPLLATWVFDSTWWLLLFVITYPISVFILRGYYEETMGVSNTIDKVNTTLKGLEDTLNSEDKMSLLDALNIVVEYASQEIYNRSPVLINEAELKNYIYKPIWIVSESFRGWDIPLTIYLREANSEMYMETSRHQVLPMYGYNRGWFAYDKAFGGDNE